MERPLERPLRRALIGLAALLCAATQVFSQLCEKPCRCPGPVPQCAPGVPLVLDGCHCCQVCARQQGELCTEMLPCDSQRGLQCDYSASFPEEPGACVSQEDLGCEVNGVTYQQGQSFQPSCDSHCRCSGGGVTCVPACPLNARLPTPDCPNPQYVLLPGKCCKEWVCEDLQNTVIQDAITALRSKPFWPTPSQARNLNKVAPPTSCVERSTQWSACSRSCGAGISTRVSNQNPGCKLEIQTRLCKVRPCQTAQPAPGKSMRTKKGRCKASYRSHVPIRLVHQGCYSLRPYRLRYCGQCTDSRCCTPNQTHTAEVAFRCPSGGLLKRAVMMIHSCTCHYNCPHAPFSNPALWGIRP
ncbi:WNT1-inducible-signaling pathway protein 2 [Thalassophryne amazonica]|uniref:WNT1-inducible-signaling pathway protein 2 n=1 Tax=Thalassophryne amazonica TaxID=390379 RepID=UPI0014721AE6|nr:WNT1-inducible-signaling pathway protein 2 [Thalassophryne amazonica]